MYGGNPLENPDYGKIINLKHYKRLCGLMDQNKVFFGGDKDESQGRIAPTLLTDVLPDDPIMQEEIFGPLLPIIKVENIETAIHFVQRREHPLAVYLFANDRAVEEFVMREISFGGGCVNDVISHIVSPNLPFGGVGASGFGAYHGQTSFTTFSHKKAIVRRATWCDPSLRYPPYTPKKLRWLKRFL